MAFRCDEQTGKVIDDDNDAELISVRGFSDGTKQWEIVWGDKVFGFKARDTITYGGERDNTPVAIEWFIASMQIPENLTEKRGELMGMIKDALMAKGLSARFKGPVSVKFDQRLIQSF